MQRNARPFWVGLLIIAIILTLSVGINHVPGQRNATMRVNGFNEAINANRPADIYPYLIPELREMLSKEEFMRNFAKERYYPYLSPLYVYLDEVKLASDRQSGEAISTVAARLPGQKMNVKLVYIRGQYYIEAFRDIADGSYLLKFQNIVK